MMLHQAVRRSRGPCASPLLGCYTDTVDRLSLGLGFRGANWMPCYPYRLLAFDGETRLSYTDIVANLLG